MSDKISINLTIWCIVIILDIVGIFVIVGILATQDEYNGVETALFVIVPILILLTLVYTIFLCLYICADLVVGIVDPK